jgi:hypothetical protein
MVPIQILFVTLTATVSLLEYSIKTRNIFTNKFPWCGRIHVHRHHK